MQLFVDENLDGDAFVGPIERAGIIVRRHRDHFAQGTPDPLWIPEVARIGWIIVSRDKRIRRNDDELRALIRAEARLLVLTVGKEMTTRRLAQNVVNSRAKIIAFFERHPPPCAATLRRPQTYGQILEGKPGTVNLLHLPKR